MLHQERVRTLKKGDGGIGPVAYWMSRDQRVKDNWALLFAQETALQRKESMAVLFCLVPEFLNAGLRHYEFMLKGLQKLEKDLSEMGIPFYLVTGTPKHQVPRFIHQHRVGVLVTDFDPLRIKMDWKKAVASRMDIACYEVDARNIVPCWKASSKQEYAAYTLRPKIKRALGEFLSEFPSLQKHPFAWNMKERKTNWEKIRKTLKVHREAAELGGMETGEDAAQDTLRRFLADKLSDYDARRNDPTIDGQSNLSPYLHFGQISAQRVALEVSKSNAAKGAKEAFLEELIVRRELSDNFCFYNENYDNFEGFPDWAKNSLHAHRKDARAHTYSIEVFEKATTHDALWNAAQKQMTTQGKMHGYMRMYWGKKILEWTDSPEKALEVANYLNDRYELDGRETNGYTGIAWCIGGVHDRAWPERPVFGKVRYMSYNGCKSKFDVKSYIDQNME